MEPLGQFTATEICKEAAAWLVEMDDEPEGFDRPGFVGWLKASPRHIEEFLFVSATWRALDDMPRVGTTHIQQWLQELGVVVPLRDPDIAQPTPSLGDDRRTRRVIHRLRWVAVVAALTLLSVSAAWLWSVYVSHEMNVLTTVIGEQRAVRLADGSIVHLNTDSRVEIRFTERDREVRLIQGEVLFTAEHDANRPFRVIADGIQIEALGTQFNVRRRASDTIISVVEGRVSVVAAEPRDVLPAPAGQAAGSSQLDMPAGQDVETASPPGAAPAIAAESHRAVELAVLAAGQQVRIAMDGTIEQQAIENVVAATAWRQRQLIFRNTPLSEVAAELARYNVAPRLEIQGEALRARPLDGAFAADDPQSLIQFLARDAELSVTHHGETVVIRSR